MTAFFHNLLPAFPEILLMAIACIALMADVFSKKSQGDLSYYLVQFGLIGATVLTWMTYHGGTHILFDGSFIMDPLAFILKMFIYPTTFFVFLYSRDYVKEKGLPVSEYYVLGMLATNGAMIMVSAYSLLTLFMGLELMSLPIYALVAIQRKKYICVEAAMKYFVVGIMASGLLLYGMSMIYGATRTLSIPGIFQVVNQMSLHLHMLLVLGLVFSMVGIVFKLGAAPFHMWVPDVYEGSPTCVAMLISNVPKIAGFALAIRLLVEAMPGLALQWHEIFILVAILSMAIGNIVAIAQTNLKRMLAYSSIAHMGYMILGLACATPDGDAAAMFYIVSYSVMTVAAFGLITLVSRQGFEAENIDDFSGLNSRNPWLAFLMLLVMFSLAGIPPIVGFIAKLGILEALIQVHLTWLAVVALLFAIIGAYYYLRVVKVMYFEDPVIDQPLQCRGDAMAAITFNTLILLLMGIFPGALFAICHAVF